MPHLCLVCQTFDRMILGRMSLPGAKCFKGITWWKYWSHKWYAIRKSLGTAGLSGTVGWARTAKAGRLDSLPGQSYRKLEKQCLRPGVDEMVQGNGSPAIDSLTVRQHSSRKQPRDTRCKQAGIGAVDHLWPGLPYWRIYRQIPEIWRILKAFGCKYFGLAIFESIWLQICGFGELYQRIIFC